MPDDRKYSRVYHDAQDDPRFESVWPSDANLALWLRLLVLAEGAWPAPAPIPRTARKAALAALVSAGLVDLMPHDLYRIHGMNAERTRRSKQAAHAAAVRWHSNSTATSNARSNARSNAEPMLDKTSKDKTSKDETSTRQDEHLAREGLPNLDQGAIRALEHRTGRTWGQAGEKQLTEYDRLIEDHGLESVLSAMDRLITDGKPMTARQLVWGAMKVLEPMVSVQSIHKEDAEQERQEERDRNSRRGVEATQRYLADLRATGSREAS